MHEHLSCVFHVIHCQDIAELLPKNKCKLSCMAQQLQLRRACMHRHQISA